MSRDCTGAVPAYYRPREPNAPGSLEGPGFHLSLGFYSVPSSLCP